MRHQCARCSKWKLVHELTHAPGAWRPDSLPAGAITMQGALAVCRPCKSIIREELEQEAEG
jgi:hypothetical protein